MVMTPASTATRIALVDGSLFVNEERSGLRLDRSRQLSSGGRPDGGCADEATALNGRSRSVRAESKFLSSHFEASNSSTASA